MHGIDELPARYGRDQITLLTRDPEWLFAFWEFGSEPARLEVVHVDEWSGALTPVFHKDVDAVGSCYVRVPVAGEVYAARLFRANGIRLESNTVRTPPGRVSDRQDAAWAAVRELVAWEDFELLATSPGAVGRRARWFEQLGASHSAPRGSGHGPGN